MWKDKIKNFVILLLAPLVINAQEQIENYQIRAVSNKNRRCQLNQPVKFQVVVLSGKQQVYSFDETTDFLQMEQKIEDSVVRADLEYLRNVYAEDFRFAHGSGSVQNKAQWLASVAKRQFISRKISASEVELHDDIAVTAARLDVIRRGKNGEENYWLKYIRVYRKSSNGWKMISHRTTQETHL